MEKDYKIINVVVTDPADSIFKSNRNDAAECRITLCNNSENCQLFERGECALHTSFGARSCPYGRPSYEGGPTKRAKKYRTWISDRKERHKDQFRKLGSYKDMIAVVGDYIFLPYAHMNMNKNVPFLAHGGVFANGSHMIPAKDFTPDMIANILSYSPQAMIGGTITSYQKEVIPKFVKHLQENMPDMFSDVAAIYPSIKEILTSYSYVGRKAYLHSLRSGVTLLKYHDTSNLKTQNWIWDGTYLSSIDTGLSFAIVEYSEISIRIKPKDGVTVEITSDDQVDNNTKFST